MFKYLNIASAILILFSFFFFFWVVDWNNPYSTEIQFVGMDYSEKKKELLLFNEEINKNEIIRLGFVGDLMQHNNYAQADFEKAYYQVRDFLKTFDILMGNMEFPINPSQKIGPALFDVKFNGSLQHLNAIRDCGFDILSISNNHVYDQKYEGIYNTIHEIESRNMYAAGYHAEKELQAQDVIVKEVKGIRIALLAYTYNVNSYHNDFLGKVEWYPKDIPVTVINFNDWQRERNYYLPVLEKDYRIAKEEKKADVVVAYNHWGDEWRLTPDDNISSAARDMAIIGFDVIIGSHQHVLNPVEWDEDCFIAYGLGNFLSDFRPWQTRTSCILGLKLLKDIGGNCSVIDYSIYPTITNRDDKTIEFASPSSTGENKRAWDLAVQLFGSKVKEYVGLSN